MQFMKKRKKTLWEQEKMGILLQQINMEWMTSITILLHACIIVQT